jgi:hypothetical protein
MSIHLLFTVVACPLSSPTSAVYHTSFGFALFKNFTENFILIVRCPTVHGRATLCKGISERLGLLSFIFGSFDVGVFGDGGFALGCFGMKLFPNGEVTRVFLAIIRAY